MPGKTGANPKRRKIFRRKLPCKTHPSAPAVACCEVCNQPICRECVATYKGDRICGSDCWNYRASMERKQASVEKKKKEKKADLAVIIGMLSVCVLILAGIGFFVYQKLSNHSGEKLWELDNTEGFYEYFVAPQFPSFFALSTGGNMEAIDAASGEKKWKVKIPEPEETPEEKALPEELREKEYLSVLIVNENKSLVYGKGRLMLCTLASPAPAWKYNPPQPVVSAQPILSDDRIILASRSKTWYENLTEIERFTEQQLSTGQFQFSYRQHAEEKPVYAVSAVALNSGEQLWSTDMGELRVSDLMADQNHIYLVTYATKEEDETAPTDTTGADAPYEQETVITQLWALELATGKPDWKLEAEGYFSWPPTPSDEGILFATYKDLYLVSPTGEVKWKYPLNKQYIKTLEPYEDKVLFSLSDGSLNCITLANSQLKWRIKPGAEIRKIIVSAPLVFASALAKKELEPLKVIPTKRWKGSEDLLKNALKRDEITYEGILFGIDLETGETRWSIPKIMGDFQFSRAFLYALRYSERLQLMDPTVDPTEFSRTVSHLSVFDCMSGEKAWEVAIDGYASDMQITDQAIIVTSEEAVSTAGRGDEKVPVRLIGICLE